MRREVEPCPYADPQVAARKLVEIASTIEPVQNGRIYIEHWSKRIGDDR